SLVIFFAISPEGDSFQRRSLFLTVVVLFCLLNYPLPDSLKRSITGGMRKAVRAVDYVLMVVTIGAFAYVFFNSHDLMMSAGTATDFEIVLGYVAVFLVLEVTRRAFGTPVVIMCVCFLLYGFLGQFLPGVLEHPGLS